MASRPPRQGRDKSPTFGIGEWFGRPMTQLTAEERRALGVETLKPKNLRAATPCPFRAVGTPCSKEGGVCSIRLYNHAVHAPTGRAMGEPAPAAQGSYRITCPYRFHERDMIFDWVGEVILGDGKPIRRGEVGFLESSATTDSEAGEDVGRIDMVLVSSKTHPTAPMEWCALEIQAVYFSGAAMRGEFEAASDPSLTWLHFPAGKRHPDYRSSAPKRLMPQLQIKVPTLRRWGKKMAVVVDQAFFDSMGAMDHVDDISNADIAWFVIDVEETSSGSKLIQKSVKFTTLERSVEGLTGGTPVTKSVFEERLAYKKAPSAS